MGKAIWLATAALCGALLPAVAQETLIPVEQSVPAPLADAPSVLPPAAGAVAEGAPNPDEMADFLNAQQQIKQGYTFTRTINGEVVEIDKRTITYSRDDPVLPSEAGETPLERLKAAFDREVLTRIDAFEEAKLDFVVADLDRDGAMTGEEFAYLAATWRDTEARDAAAAAAKPTPRERQYQAFLDELDIEEARRKSDVNARRRFAFMAGASAALSREDYIREYLLDFDAMDVDDDSLLKADELSRFRAVKRGDAAAAAAGE